MKILGKELHEAQLEYQRTGTAARVFKDFSYCTRKSWSRERRMVGKAEHLAKGSNPRLIVTSLSAERCNVHALYEVRYCACGEMENRIKEQQLCLFADRTSCATRRAHQLRLWPSSVAYVLLQALIQHGAKDTEFATAPRCDTVRLKLLKVGAHRSPRVVLLGVQLPVPNRLRPHPGQPPSLDPNATHTSHGIDAAESIKKSSFANRLSRRPRSHAKTASPRAKNTLEKKRKGSADDQLRPVARSRGKKWPRPAVNQKPRNGM